MKGRTASNELHLVAVLVQASPRECANMERLLREDVRTLTRQVTEFRAEQEATLHHVRSLPQKMPAQ